MGMKYCGLEFKCIVTGNFSADLHHLITRGAGGSDSTSNLMPLAHALHQECHAIGLTKFALKYPIVKEWLLEHNWEFDETRNKWVAPSACRK